MIRPEVVDLLASLGERELTAADEELLASATSEEWDAALAVMLAGSEVISAEHRAGMTELAE